MQNKCDLAQEMYETIIETPNTPNSIRANAYKQLGEYKLCQLTVGSWGSMHMLRYEACRKFREHERGVRVTQGAAKCNCVLFKLCKKWFAYSIAHARWWQQQHPPTHLPSVNKLKCFSLGCIYKTHGKRFSMYYTLFSRMVICPFNLVYE